MKRAKNDRNDAEAICEAAGRPGMRFVPVKTTTQQAQGMVLKVRETLVHQRTQLVNALAATPLNSVSSPRRGSAGHTLLEAIEAAKTIPSDAKECWHCSGQEIEHLDIRLNEIELKLTATHKANALSQRLATISGVGRIIALTLAIEVDPMAFEIRPSFGGLDRVNAERAFDRREATHGRYRPAPAMNGCAGCLSPVPPR